jgi:hypothetical protein
MNATAYYRRGLAKRRADDVSGSLKISMPPSRSMKTALEK